MSRKKLTKQEIVKFLIEAKEFYVNSGKSFGLCNAILNCENFPTDDANEIKKIIPGFNITNARRLGSKYKFLRPNGESSWYWWNNYTTEGKNARISFLNALIKEIENND